MFDYRRTHDCNSLGKADIGKNVTLSGWVHRRRDHGGLIFIDLRDRYGLTQLVFDPKFSLKAHEEASSLRQEWVISIKGKVSARAEGMANPKLKTGAIEVRVEELGILSKAKNPPFSISEEAECSDELRLKYRYLDMRRGPILEKLKVRHQAMLVIRNFLDKKGFMEITTPILCKSTPEGARDYLVPSRIHAGNFYALPQSPQLFKQILMIGGADKYFQIAPCFRDEDLRSDRQPEFVQVDMEVSFLTVEDLHAIIEEMVKTLFTSFGYEIKLPFLRMSYDESMERFGCDKPDLRFDMSFHRIDEIIEASDCPFLKEILEKGGSVKAFLVKGGAELSRKALDDYAAFVKPFHLSGLYSIKKTHEGINSSLAKFLPPPLMEKILSLLKAEENDLILLAGAEEAALNQAFDHLRRHIAKERNLIDDSLKFAWIVDFPLFATQENGSLTSEHHPFTSPRFEDLPLLDKDPKKVKALAYDLVLNGYEIAGGSQRIHDSELQEKIFQLLQLSKEEIRQRFGFFINALTFGTPPHLGIAFGLDRLIMLLTKTDNIRDVIAFPKTQKASDLMTEAPSMVTEEQLKELHIKVTDYEEIAW